MSVCLVSNSQFHPCGTFPQKVRASGQGARVLLREGARAAGGLDWLRRSFLRRVAGASAVPEVGARVASLNGNADPEVGARVASPNGNTDAEVGARVASLNGSSDQDPLWTPLWQRRAASGARTLGGTVRTRCVDWSRTMPWRRRALLFYQRACARTRTRK